MLQDFTQLWPIETCKVCFFFYDLAENLNDRQAVAQSRVGGQLLLDPTADESYHEDGAVLLAMMPTANLVGSHCFLLTCDSPLWFVLT